MDRKTSIGQADANPIVYVRPIQVSDLPEELRREAGPAQTIYAVHDASGERIALVRDRRMAFILARQNDLAPVHAH